MSNPCVILLVNLFQDVNILRPLAYIAARDLGFDTRFLITRDFLKRDRSGKWRAELDEIAGSADISINTVDDEAHALQLLQGVAGVIVAASESNLPGHRIVHNIFRLKPSSLVAITLQHGFECVGFLQSRDHDIAHGRAIAFAADIVCGWCEKERLTSLAPSQANKLCVTGPTSVLQQQPRRAARSSGIVCENLHSVRLNIAGDFKGEFVSLFARFCEALGEETKQVVLRPHPGGQYVIKNNVALPPNVQLNNHPMYKVNLSSYAYGISAPSSVLIDMVLAGIPTAVWRESSGVMDVGNYKGLTEVSDLADWLAFEKEAVAHPERFLERQADFLREQKMLTDSAEVYRRFAELLWATAQRASGKLRRPAPPIIAQRRILLIANSSIPTLQLSFLKPLAPLIDARDLDIEVLTEEQMKETVGPHLCAREVHPWLDNRMATFKPTAIVFCRYSGPYADYVSGKAREIGVPVIFHVDDDLLNIPLELGVVKHAFHNEPTRLATVRHLLDVSDLVYCSTPALKSRFEELGAKAPLLAGEIYASGKIMVQPHTRPAIKVGYMGFDHAHDLETVLSALIVFLRKYPHTRFELFGSIPKPDALEEFGDRITLVRPVRNYEDFLVHFSKLNWDIGICPLVRTPFNIVKANTKWVEYTSMGIATIATSNTVYDECCADGCGLLADTEAEWLAALERLLHDPVLRCEQVQKAQARLQADYSVGRLKDQVLDIIHSAENGKIRSYRSAHGSEPNVTETENPGVFLSRLSQQWSPKSHPSGVLHAPLQRRVLFVANGYTPTLQLSFVKPLAPLVLDGRLATDFITEKQINEKFGKKTKQAAIRLWLDERLHSFMPNTIVFCRYSGPHSDYIAAWAASRDVTVLYHIDDDILNVPMDLGEAKHAYHNQPERLATVRTLLDTADLVYCSNANLQTRMRELGAKAVLKAGKVYASGAVIVPARNKPVVKMGYMASADHAHNLEMIMPALVQVLRHNPDLHFELFGSIPKLAAFDEFGDRVTKCPPISNYDEFMQSFAALEWDIGICPLVRSPFNVVKSNTKWVEYTSVGAAVVASRNTVYDGCCADGCGLLADTTEEWIAALDHLVNDPQARYTQVRSAQDRLTTEYSIDDLRDQVLSFFAEADVLHRSVSYSFG